MRDYGEGRLDLDAATSLIRVFGPARAADARSRRCVRSRRRRGYGRDCLPPATRRDYLEQLRRVRDAYARGGTFHAVRSELGISVSAARFRLALARELGRDGLRRGRGIACDRPPELIERNERRAHRALSDSRLRDGNSARRSVKYEDMDTDADTDRFAQLFDHHAPELLRYCFRRTADAALAEDLVSVVFLEAWRRRADLRENADPLPWLYGIATNVVRGQWRSRRRHAAALSRIGDTKRQRDPPLMPTNASRRCARCSRGSPVCRAASRTCSRCASGASSPTSRPRSCSACRSAPCACAMPASPARSACCRCRPTRSGRGPSSPSMPIRPIRHAQPPRQEPARPPPRPSASIASCATATRCASPSRPCGSRPATSSSTPAATHARRAAHARRRPALRAVARSRRRNYVVRT